MKFKGTDQLPSLEFDEDIGHIRISGRSIGIEPKDFWLPLREKMIEYLKDPRDISLELKLEFFNTPSAKQILEFLRIIDNRTAETGRKFVITWIDDGDEDMREAGEDFASLINKNTTWRFK